MPQKLSSQFQLYNLARDLGLRVDSNPVETVLEYCDHKIETFLKELEQLGGCESLTAFLDWVAHKVGTCFEEVTSDAELSRIRDKYVSEGEKPFANLEAELSESVFGITIRRTNHKHFEHPFVSVIDLREDKLVRRYFTKWHEVAHLLTLTDQRRLTFKRTHTVVEARDPEEQLMDIIAGRFGFYGPVFHRFISGDISFEQIERLRTQLCPDASLEASMISFAQNWPSPCMYIKAALAMKKDEERSLRQGSFDFFDKPTPKLRAVSVTLSNNVSDERFRIFKNKHVPESSIAYKVFSEDGYGIEIEDLATWTEKESLSVRIEARRRNDNVEVLIVPAEASQRSTII